MMENAIKKFEHMGTALLIFDDQMKVVHVNAKAEEILQLRREDLLGLSIQVIDSLILDLQGESLPLELSPLRRTILEDKDLIGRKFTLRRKDGTCECISLDTASFSRDDGSLRGLVASFTRCCRSEERLQQFIGAMDEIAFEFDSKGRYLNVWTENEELLKVPRHQIIGGNVKEIIPRDITDQLFEAFHRIQETGKPVTFEYPLNVLGGRRWFLARVALVPPVAEGGEPTFSFLARDISGMKLLEQNLRDSENRFRGLFENAASGIALVGLDGRCLETNHCLREMLGYSEEELRKKPFSEYSHPEEISEDMEQFERMVRGEISSYQMEKRFLRKDGKILWGHLTVALQRTENGSPVYSIAILENITRRKHVEQEKEHLLGELKAIFNFAGDGIILYDESGNILRLNEAAKEILGYSDELIHSSLAERHKKWAPRNPDGSMLSLEESALFRVFQGEATRRTVAQYTRSDGQVTWIAFSASPVFDSSGRQIGAVSTITDITRMRELQERLEDYIHMLAHDLRSPLTVISGHAEILENLLQQIPAVKEGRESIHAILGASEQMQSMMEDLVEVGRLESGQVTLHFDVIHLSEFIEKFLGRQLSREFRRIRTEISPDLPSVRVGRNHLERVLENLVGNALKYSGPDQPVEIRALRSGGQVCIEVQDFGQGIAEEDLSRVFDRFYRASSARSKTGGTGMGLFITRRLIESYRGTIRVESQVGKGSTFTICIPEAD